MRLLSFLSQIEAALAAPHSRAAVDWEITRIVNYHTGAARLSLTPGKGVRGHRAGSIFLQAFLLGNGSLCVKACLNWSGSEESPVVSVFASPDIDWDAKAGEIASAWESGPTQFRPEAVPLAELRSVG